MLTAVAVKNQAGPRNKAHLAESLRMSTTYLVMRKIVAAKPADRPGAIPKPIRKESARKHTTSVVNYGPAKMVAMPLPLFQPHRTAPVPLQRLLTVER